MKIFRNKDNEQVQVWGRCFSGSDCAARGEAAREAAQFKVLMMSGARLV
jgi:hypothetical protein